MRSQLHVSPREMNAPFKPCPALKHLPPSPDTPPAAQAAQHTT